MKSRPYKTLSTAVLEAKWRSERERVSKIVGVTLEDCAELIAMRDELDLRRDKPSVDVDFEKYITD